MLFFRILLVIAVTFTEAVATSCDNKTNPIVETLVFVHTVFKHCHHVPDKRDLFPNDIHIKETYAPFGYGQLTTKGKKHCFSMGQFIRERYDGYIVSQFTKQTIWAVSTNYRRTKMSLEVVLSGIFPPTIDDMFVVNQQWQPMSFIYEDGPGLIAPAVIYCNKFIRKYCRYQHSNEAITIYTPYKQFYAELAQYAGYEINVPDDLRRLYTVLKCQEEFGLQIPAWAHKYYPTILEETYAMSFKFQTATKFLARHNAGFLLKRILDDTEAKINNLLHVDRKMHIYAAHDYNIAALLNVLGVFEAHVPVFGASIFFEVHLIDNVYGIKLYYHDFVATEPKLLTIPGCNEFCALETLKEIVKDYLPKEHDSCTIRGEMDDDDDDDDDDD